MPAEPDDLNLESDDDDDDPDPHLAKYRVTSYPADFTLKGYLDKYNEQQLVVPPFQRKYVWELPRASKLIESFLLGLPVPPVFLYKERGSRRLLVIDGQQRILSAIKFLTNDFNDGPFRLKKVSAAWLGKSYAELPQPDKNQLNDSVLRATIIEQLDPDDDSSIYHIFERLNTGAVSLSPMEVRKCVHFGPYFEMLEAANRLDSWREILGTTREDRRLRDVELVLRSIAMGRGMGSYDKPVKSFLNSFLTSRRKPRLGEDPVAADRDWFTSATARLVAILGKRPFHLRGRLNVAALDTIMPLVDAFAHGSLAVEAPQRYELLKKNAQFVEDTHKSTSDKAVVLRRFELARHYLVDHPLADLA